MFSTIFSFELKQHFKKPFTWIFLLLMMAQGLYYMRHTGEFFGADKTYANAPAILYTVLAGIGYIGFIVTAILGGTALAKDLDYRTSSLLYTTRASQQSFFWGRYLGSITILLLLNAGYLLGIILYSYLPVANLGPLSWTAILKAVLFVFLPNIFVIYSLCFSVSVFTRSAKTAYGISLMAMLLMIFAETSFNNNASVVLADPTAFSVLHAQLEHFSPAQKNNYSPGFSGYLFYNRLIWVSIGMLSLLIAARKYSFSKFGTKNEGKSKTKAQDALPLLTKPILHTEPLRKVSQYFSLSSTIRKAFSLSWLEFKSVIRPLGFKIFLGMLLIIYVCYIAVWQQQYYSAAPTLPVTIEITGVTLPLSFYFLMFIIINTTELLFKNQSTGFWQIGDALPLPTWVTVTSKIMAMLGVALLVTTCLMLFGMLVQALKGYHHFELEVYFNDLFIRWIPKYLTYIFLCVFVAGITANRYATHWISILILIISVILHEIEVIEQNRLNFMFSPGSAMNTDMNGNGIFSLSHAWFMTYWTSFGLAIFSIGLWLWQRGTPSTLGKRMLKKVKFSPVLLLLFIIGFAGFFYCHHIIYQTVNVENKFQAKADERNEQASYEKAYLRYRTSPQPKILNLELQLELYPEKRSLTYNSRLKLNNPTRLPIDTLHIEWMDFSAIDQLSIPGYTLKLIKEDQELRHNTYLLNHSFLPGDQLTLNIKGNLHYRGFTNDDPQKELTFNGTFLSQDLIPYFGYDDRRALKLNKYRLEHNMKKISSRLPDVNDPLAATQLFASTQADRMNYTLDISTTADQDIVAPGVLKKEWKKAGRHHYQFVSEKPDVFSFHILSAKYAQKKETIQIGGKTLHIEISYHPTHAYNVNHLMQSAKEALQFLHKTLGDYPYQTLRIAERPRYDQDLFSSGNLIVLPENHGWIADIRRQEDLDYLRYITAKLIAQQYMQQADVSRTQGFPVITQSIPGYLAYQQLQHFYGAASLEKHLEKSHDLYLKGRAKEQNTEPVLIKSDEDASYVSNQKGSDALYRLSKLTGEEVINQAISTFLKESQHPAKPVNAWLFYDLLKTAVSEKDKTMLVKIFESTGE